MATHSTVVNRFLISQFSNNLHRATSCTCNSKTLSGSLKFLRNTHKYAHAAPKKPNKYKTVYRDLHGVIGESSAAKDFVFALNPDERSLLHEELQRFDHGTGQSGGQNAASGAPTTSQLKSVGLHNALPFIGFGFLDNFLMIIAGEYIEITFGAALGISTMAAAALGNWISDLAGVQSAHYIEVLSSKFGVRAPALTPQQVDMSSTRWASNIGKAIGISIGCILGMFPLLFYKPIKKTPKEAPDTEDDPS